MSKFIATAEIIGECKYDESGVNKVITNHKGEVKTRTWIESTIITSSISYTELEDSDNKKLDKSYKGVKDTDDDVFNNCFTQACNHFKNITKDGYTILGYKIKEIKELNLPID